MDQKSNIYLATKNKSEMFITILPKVFFMSDPCDPTLVTLIFWSRFTEGLYTDHCIVRYLLDSPSSVNFVATDVLWIQ